MVVAVAVAVVVVVAEVKVKYIRRVENFHPDFVKDIIDTLKRIHVKDGKAYPLRIWKSVSKRWKSCPRYKITLTLNYLEYKGLLVCRLESIEEYKERMKGHPGLNKKGLRRKYFSPNPKSPMESMGKETKYEKLMYSDLGLEDTRIEEYPC